ncbi:MAG: caspase family protein [Coleofasciculus sp. A1-SPW-01]|uniref:caspase family protein n=1 Tax=Coleofasciculus sp. A1-SPW-01 TaxID=3070819 RepID=UPI0032FE4421
MNSLKRRQFLQVAGSALATISLHSCQTDPRPRPTPNRLRGAQPFTRKLALLVGINTYPPNSNITPLNGCLTDVELQRNLLIYRFGFNPQDILTLTNAQATRQAILDSFETHLINQAKPGDIVVFHYSGHGSQVADPDADYADGVNSTLVPFDSPRPAAPNPGIVRDIMGHTLFLLMAALNTENVTVVLDCCYSGGAKRGNLIIRAVRGGAQFQASSEEQAYQQQWLSRLNWTSTVFKQRRRQGVAKGVVITSTNRHQLAADYPFDGFSAGAFTYLMSQYLWQHGGDEPIGSILPAIAQRTTQISFTLQTPEYEVKPGSNTNKQPIYFLDELTPAAEAAITQVNGTQVELWLGGVNAQSLAAFNQDAIFAAINPQGQFQGTIQLESRQGLVGYGKLLDTSSSLPLQPGTPCVEQVRGIPQNLSLRIGLSPSLGKDITQAKAVLTSLNRIQTLPLQETEVDYILGRLTEKASQNLRLNPSPPLNSLGLFSPGLNPMPNSFGEAGEAVVDGVNRLETKFKSLLAVRLLKMLLNADTAELNITARLSRIDANNQFIAQVFPKRSRTGLNSTTPSRQSINSTRFTQLPLATPVQLNIVNNESRPVYVSVLVIDATGEITLLFPHQWAVIEDAAQVKAGETLLIPNPSRDTFHLQTQKPLGVTEVLIIASVTPVRNALKALQTIAKRRNLDSEPVVLPAPIEVIEQLLSDLTPSRDYSVSVTSGISPVDTSQFAAMSITFEVISTLN